MIFDTLKDLNDFLYPSDEELYSILKKINNHEKLDFNDFIIIKKVQFINFLIKNKDSKI